MAQHGDLAGKVALVTGGSRGLGLAMVNGFASHGADVIVASRRLERCEAVAADVARRTGRQALAVQFHAGNWSDADRLVDQVYDRFERCDVLVNNAGSSPLYPSLSISAVQPRPTELVYAGAKAALNTLTIGLCRAFVPNVRVNAIMPGAFMTDISAAWDDDEFARTAAEQIPAGRGGQPAEIVGAAIYLASDAASYTTGAVLKVDGGWSYAPA